jgi:hypothetical protein
MLHLHHETRVIFFGFAFLHKADDNTTGIEETKVILVTVHNRRSMPAIRKGATENNRHVSTPRADGVNVPLVRLTTGKG